MSGSNHQAAVVAVGVAEVAAVDVVRQVHRRLLALAQHRQQGQGGPGRLRLGERCQRRVQQREAQGRRGDEQDAEGDADPLERLKAIQAATADAKQIAGGLKNARYIEPLAYLNIQLKEKTQ